MSLETIKQDFYNGSLSQEEYERNGIDFKPKEYISSNRDNKFYSDLGDGEISLTEYIFTVMAKDFKKEYIIEAKDEKEAHKIFMNLYEDNFDKGLINWSYTQDIKR